MDDIIVLAPTRWKLRRVVKTLDRELDALQLEKHPGKTFIGRIEKGFDFLGYRFTPRSLTSGTRGTIAELSGTCASALGARAGGARGLPTA